MTQPILPGAAPTRRTRRWARAVGVAVAVVLVAAACGDDDGGPAADGGAAPGGPAPDAPTIVATTSIWADVVANVACDGLARVDTLIPVGGDPHSFEPSLADRATMEDAVLVVANGLLLEEGLADTIDAVESAGTPVFRVAEHVETIPYSFAGGDHSHDDEEEAGGDHAHDDEEEAGGDHAHDDEEEAGGDHAHEGDDPHVWFDPRRVGDVLDELAERLVDDAGLDETAVAECVDDFRAQLSALDGDVAEMVESVPVADRTLVTSHDSLGYFADRYGFEVIGTVIPAPSGLAETNPAQLEELAVLIEETGVPAIFAETQHSVDDAEALAARVGGVEVVTLFTGTLGDADSGADSYLGFIRTNAELVVSALS